MQFHEWYQHLINVRYRTDHSDEELVRMAD
jgi:hypothetical protein